MVRSTIYGEDFLGFSYRFRHRCGQPDALDVLTAKITRQKADWILDADIVSFFDEIDHN
jgi:retron-type reverse transcriptase